VGSASGFDYSGLSGTAAMKARAAADRIRGYQHGAMVDRGRELLTMKAAIPKAL
jgi:hypothetical protein